MFASPVARRFYQAFFRWNTTTSASICQRSVQIAVTSRRFSAQPIKCNSNYVSHDAQTNSETQKGRHHEATSGTEIDSTMRLVMRKLPQPVVVVTALAPDTELCQRTSTSTAFASSRGMTVSSFTTVSVTDRNVIISFNIRKPSSTWDAITHHKRFAIHILEASAEGAHIAGLFTKGDAQAGFTELVEQKGDTLRFNLADGSASLSCHAERGAVVRSHEGAMPQELLNAPQIMSKAVFAQLDCRLLSDNCVSVGDHVIVVAEVCNFQNMKQSIDVLDADKAVSFLGYWDRHFVSKTNATGLQVPQPSASSLGQKSAEEQAPLVASK
ncbi:flavin reductase like domain-containing protein [Phyllosticta citribraziliensis]|uniref:Flavin reductase like domain-containing protein n=1 Tax=Phyllosticta citribraziliensis TaxID=989973 RepID=A0ABR1M973_9PEZI